MTDMPTSVPLHLWIYNHPFVGISDQLDFFLHSLRQHGYTLTIGRQPRDHALNIVIENFSLPTRDQLIAYCRKTHKRVAVIMTEHIDFIRGSIFIHGNPLWNSNDYMHPATQVTRLRCLMECRDYIANFLVLGDLPELINSEMMLPGIDVRTIPFPTLSPVPPAPPLPCTSDLLFTGAMTEFRRIVFNQLGEAGIQVDYPGKLMSRRVRNLMNQQTRLILNLPQRAEWKWLSLMRIYAGLLTGKATVSVATADDSRIAQCTRQISMASPGWTQEVKTLCAHWQDVRDEATQQYNTMAEEFAKAHPFPHDAFEFWAMTDNLG